MMLAEIEHLELTGMFDRKFLVLITHDDDETNVTRSEAPR